MTLQKLQKYLNDNNLYYDYIYETDETFIIGIEWGDWKHEHQYLNYLMNKANLQFKSSIITDENGSDCYSAEYKYYKN